MRLDVLRRYRAQLEEVVRMDLFHLRQELQDAEASVRAHDAQARFTAEAYLAKANRGMALEEFLEWQSRFQAEASVLAQARLAEEHLGAAWERKQGELREAMQDLRKLDRLAERMRQQRTIVQHRIDQIDMDEAARRTSVM
jgi:flagellar export protein FliJ